MPPQDPRPPVGSLADPQRLTAIVRDLLADRRDTSPAVPPAGPRPRP